MKILVTVLVSLALTFGIMGCAPKEEPKEPPAPQDQGETEEPEAEKKAPAEEKEAPADEEEAPAETTPDDETAE